MAKLGYRILAKPVFGLLARASAGHETSPWIWSAREHVCSGGLVDLSSIWIGCSREWLVEVALGPFPYGIPDDGGPWAFRRASYVTLVPRRAIHCGSRDGRLLLRLAAARVAGFPRGS